MSNGKFELNWEHIQTCVHEEMYPKFANKIRGIVDNQNDKTLNKESTENVLKILEKKTAQNERNYLQKLIQRANEFQLVKRETNISKNKATIVSNNNTKELTPDLLRDIFDTHRFYVWSTQHFEEYSLEQFKNEPFVKENVSGIDFSNLFCFYSQYIINDDLFEIIDELNAFSDYAHYLLSDAQRRIDLKCIVIPSKVQCVYDEKICFDYGIGSVDKYLLYKGVTDYQRNILKLDRAIEYYYNSEDFAENTVDKLLIVIDRRGAKKIIYFIPTNNFSVFEELNSLYFIGLDFHFSHFSRQYYMLSKKIVLKNIDK